MNKRFKKKRLKQLEKVTKMFEVGHEEINPVAPEYCTYENHPTKRVTIHKITCTRAENRQENTRNGRWLNFASFEQAQNSAKALTNRTMRFCRICTPQG